MTQTLCLNSYEVRLNRVIDYIYDHLDEDLSVDRFADVACLSPDHRHRIYTAMHGETISATVKPLRLLRAADSLANTEMPIKHIAQRAGYVATESFGRAFKGAYRDLRPVLRSRKMSICRPLWKRQLFGAVSMQSCVTRDPTPT